MQLGLGLGLGTGNGNDAFVFHSWPGAYLAGARANQWAWHRKHMTTVPYSKCCEHQDSRPESRGGQTLHAPIHKGSNLGTGLRKLAGSSVIAYRSSSQPEPDQNSAE